ncbi:MAG TPA: homoprotocatechuate degradation operon regulator HpaR [Alphaproteobacteria bacterium]|jgi:homoprotocatechuate degradation regulator HpaR
MTERTARADQIAADRAEGAAGTGAPKLPMRAFARSLPMQLLRAREAVMQRFRPMLHCHGVTEQQWRVIRALVEPETADIGTLAEQCCILPASLSRIVDTLEAKKLVARRAHPADQRRVVVEITPSGRKLFQAVAPHSEAHYREIAALVGAERLDAFYAMLDDITARLETKGQRRV